MKTNAYIGSEILSLSSEEKAIEPEPKSPFVPVSSFYQYREEEPLVNINSPVAIYQGQSSGPGYKVQPLVVDVDGLFRVFHIDNSGNPCCTDLLTGNTTIIRDSPTWDITQTRIQKFGNYIYFVSSWSDPNFLKVNAATLAVVQESTIDFGSYDYSLPSWSGAYNSSIFMCDDHTIANWRASSRWGTLYTLFYDLNTQTFSYALGDANIPDSDGQIYWGQNPPDLYDDEDLPLIERPDGTFDVAYVFSTDNWVNSYPGFPIGENCLYLAYTKTATREVIVKIIPTPGDVPSWGTATRTILQMRMLHNEVLMLHYDDGVVTLSSYDMIGQTWSTVWSGAVLQDTPVPHSSTSWSNHTGPATVFPQQKFFTLEKSNGNYYFTGFNVNGHADDNVTIGNIVKVSNGVATQYAHTINNHVYTPPTSYSLGGVLENLVMDNGEVLPVVQIHLPMTNWGAFSGVDYPLINLSAAKKLVVLYHEGHALPPE